MSQNTHTVTHSIGGINRYIFDMNWISYWINYFYNVIPSLLRSTGLFLACISLEKKAKAPSFFLFLGWKRPKRRRPKERSLRAAIAVSLLAFAPSEAFLLLFFASFWLVNVRGFLGEKRYEWKRDRFVYGSWCLVWSYFWGKCSGHNS